MHKCSECGAVTRLVTRRGRVRREGRVVAYSARVYECPQCVAEDGTPRLEIPDDLRTANEASAAAAWMEKVGTALPPKKKTGRKSPSPHTEVVSVRITPDQLAKLEAFRERTGGTLAQVVRTLIHQAQLHPVAEDMDSGVAPLPKLASGE